MQSYTVRQTISQFTGHQLALPTTINFYYVDSASDALAQAVQQSGLAAELLEVTENEVVPVGTSLRTFEDWGTDGDDQIRAGFPAQSLTDAEIATRQAQLDAARRYATRQQADPLTRYEMAAHALEQARAEFDAASQALRQHKQAELARRREFAMARQQERERRMSAPLGAQTGFSLMR